MFSDDIITVEVMMADENFKNCQNWKLNVSLVLCDIFWNFPPLKRVVNLFTVRISNTRRNRASVLLIKYSTRNAFQFVLEFYITLIELTMAMRE